MVIQKYLIGLG